MKESVQKMSGRKKYKGERYSFFRDKKLGHGGNGAVYDVKLEEKDDLGFPVVAKFFEYSGDDKEKRNNSVNCNRKYKIAKRQYSFVSDRELDQM